METTPRTPHSASPAGEQDASATIVHVDFRKGVEAAASTGGHVRPVPACAETIEERLEGKAADADLNALATTSLGQMSREERHKLLYGG